MSLKACIVALLLVAVSANEKQQQRYGGRPGGNFQGGHGGIGSGGFAPQGGIVGGAFGHQGGIGGGGFPGGAGHQGFQGGAGGFGQQGGFHGGAGGFGQQGGFQGGSGGFGQQGGFPGGIGGGGHLGGGGFGLGGIGNTGGAGGELQYNCAATASQGQYGIDKTCEKWCKAPQQYWGGAYICCDDRPAICPPVRSECPKFGGGLGPVCCFVDSQCQIPTDKCCYDTCLGHKVCKSAYKQGF